MTEDMRAELARTKSLQVYARMTGRGIEAAAKDRVAALREAGLLEVSDVPLPGWTARPKRTSTKRG